LVRLRERAVLYVGLLATSAAIVACASVADLGVAYDPNHSSEGGVGNDTPDGGQGAVDANRQKVRESTESRDTPPPPAPPPPIVHGCDPSGGLGANTGCDTTAGFGCCIGAANETCMETRSADALCGGLGASLFVTCRQGDGDSACCWRTAANGARSTAFAADCSGGSIACLDDSGCPSGVSCHTHDCGAPAIKIGECGKDPVCPSGI
jgi:hypothetical protein